MDMTLTPRRFAASFTFLFATLVSGCTLEVDLTTTPDSVEFNQPVDFNVEVTNPGVCPVGGIVALVFPFIPKDTLISQIDDDKHREFLSQAVDAFCSDEDFEIPDGANASCDFEDQDLVCTITGLDGEIPAASQANIPVAEAGGEGVTCSIGDGTLTCRIPGAIVEMAQQAGDPEEGLFDTLLCDSVGGIGVCLGAGLPANGTATGQLELTPDKVGVLRNFIVGFPLVEGGVCKNTLVKNVPCDPGADNQCLNVVPCATGICTSGRISNSPLLGSRSAVGAGCFVNSDCGTLDTPTCTSCGDRFLPGIDCTTTVATFNAPAPAMSTWGLAALALALLAVAVGGLRNIRRQPND